MTRVELRPLFFLIFFIALLAIACKKEYSCEKCTCGSEPLSANAGSDQYVFSPADSAELIADTTGSAATKTINWEWSKISGPGSYLFSDSSSAYSSISNLVEGVYRFGLKVTDACGYSAYDTIQIIVAGNGDAHAPVANAGPDQTDTLPADLFLLSGIDSYDPDNDIAAYQWTVVSGPAGTVIANASSVSTELKNLKAGTYQVELLVTDSRGLFSKDTVQLVLTTATLNPFACDPVIRNVIQAKMSLLGNLSRPRQGLTVLAKDQYVFFAGGNDGALSARVDIWNTRNNEWSVTQLSIPRTDVAGVAMGNRIFFAGGIGPGDSTSSRVDIYDLVTRTWSTTELSRSASNIKTAVIGNRVFFVGGSRIANGTVQPMSNAIDMYDAATNGSATFYMDEAVDLCTLGAAGSKLYIAGGQNSNGTAKKTVIIFDADQKSFSKGADLSIARKEHAGIVSGNKIIWAGGLQTSGNTSCLVEIRDINTQQPTFANLSYPVAYLDAFEINNQLVFIHNGLDYNFFFDVYNPSLNKWTQVLYDIQDRLDFTFRSFTINGRLYILAANILSDNMYSELWMMEF